MNKIGLFFSGVLAISGINLLLITSIINLVMPKLGRIAYQIAAAGSYSPNDYRIDFIYVNIAAIFLIGVGIIFGHTCYKNEKSNNYMIK